MTKFIVDTYDKYSQSDHAAARYVFSHNDNWYAIKEYEYIDNQLMRPIGIEESDQTNSWFYLYDTYEDAYQYINYIKHLQ